MITVSRLFQHRGELDAVANSLAEITAELNAARLDGFLSMALKQRPRVD
jgi:hypothetical protein